MAYLLSKTLDPLLGVFTGFLAYYLHETNPRTAPPPGHSMKELIQWQWEHSKRKRDEAAALTASRDEGELEQVRREIEAATAPQAVAASVTGKPDAKSSEQAAGPPAAASPAPKTEDRAV